MSTVDEALARAKALFRAGELRDAEHGLREIVAVDARNAEACYFLGMVLTRQGRAADAEGCFREVLALEPNSIAALGNLGNLLRQRSALEDAGQCFERILALDPQMPDAHHDLGAVRQQQGRWAEALELYQKSLALRPDSLLPLHNLGGLLSGLKRHAEAVGYFQKALALRPDFGPSHHDLGVALWELERPAEAAASYQRAIQCDPTSAMAHYNLGLALAKLKRTDEAIASYQRAIEVRPDYLEAINNLGGLLLDEQRFDEATGCFQQALALRPDSAEAHDGLGVVTSKQNRLPEAIGCYRRALELKPDYARTHRNLAYALLAAGQFAEGWREFEWRWKRPGVEEPVLPRPRWGGESLAGKTILLHCEQGYGDTLQFIRYAELVKQRGGHVVVATQPPLVALLASCVGVDEAVLPERSVPFDVHLPLASLPGVLGTTLEAIPARIPYLEPAAALVEAWRAKLAAAERFKIGIAWQGNVTHDNDRWRSIPLAEFDGIARLPGVQVFSLQMGAGREQLTGHDAAITDLSERTDGFDETAAIMRNLDLVIACDSACAHLAGALGTRVWLAVPFAPDWRWLLAREDSPWYPTMRLFRQTRPGDWRSVFERMEAELKTTVP